MLDAAAPVDPHRIALAALQDGDTAAAVAAYTAQLDVLPVGAEPERRGALLLARGLVREVAGDPHALDDAAAAMQSWSAADRGWVAGALAEVAAALGEESSEAASVYWTAAAEMLGDRPDDACGALIAGEQGRLALERGDLAGAADLLQRCRALAEAHGDSAAAAMATLGLARAALHQGDRGEARSRLDAALSAGLDEAQLAFARWLLVDLAAAAAAVGELDEAESHLHAAERSAPAADDLLHERVVLGLAGLALARDDGDRALRLCENAVASARRRGDETALAQLLHDGAVIAARMGNLDDAEQRIGESLRLAAQHRLPTVGAAAARMLAGLAQLHGEHLRALGFAEQAAAFPLSGADRLACAECLAAVGADAERWLRHDVAIAASSQAAAIFRGAGQPAAAAQCEAVLARVQALMAAGQSLSSQPPPPPAR